MKFVTLPKKDRPQEYIAVRVEDIVKVETNRFNSIVTVENHMGGVEKIDCYESFRDVMSALSSK